MELRRVRSGLVSPGNGVREETVAGIAGALRGRVQAHLEGRELGSSADLPSRKLIGGSGQAGCHTGLAAVIGMHAAQPDCGRTRMIARAVAERVRLQVREAGKYI